jgi:glucose/arabinose dehydrogenase/PKD repeat protein
MPNQRRLALVRLLCVAWLVMALTASAPALAADPEPKLPQGFSDEQILGTDIGMHVPSPTALSFLPDGRLLILSGQGMLFVWNESPAPSLQRLIDHRAKVCNNSERGFVGLAVDPNFAANGFIYIFYTRKTSSTCPVSQSDLSTLPINRLSRFTVAGDMIDPASELVLLDGIVNHGGNHNGGAVRFGPDGYLYVSLGDDSRPLLSDDDDNLRGKILRLNPATGEGAPGNMHSANPQAIRCGNPANPRIGQGRPCSEIFAEGMRNPFRITFKPGTDQFYIHDVGQQTWEEISLGQAGADYGWNTYEGPCPKSGQEQCGPKYPASTPGKTPPFFWYGHRDIDPRPMFRGCAAITGGAFVPAGIWPVSFEGTYLFADYVCGRIWTLTLDANGQPQPNIFADGLDVNSAVDLLFGPAASGGQALYYTVLNGGGQVHRIRYTGNANRSPHALAVASPVTGGVPLTVNFDASGSSDPDGDALTFLWNYGDGSPVAELTTPTTSHTYTRLGQYEATLRVRDSRGATSNTPVRIGIDAGNSAPQVTITAPGAAELFSVGEEITLRGNAVDPEDGVLEGDSLEWEVLLHHNDHTHPFLAPTPGASATITAPAPEDLDATKASYLEVRLTATDSRGVTGTITRTLQPHRVTVALATQPAGLKLTVNGTPLTSPVALTSWEGYALNLQAPDQTGSEGQRYVFTGWSDTIATSERTVITPGASASYTAVFTPKPASGPEVSVYLPVLRR